MSSRSHAFAVVLVILALAHRAVAAQSLSGTLELDPAKTLIEFRLPGTLHATHGKFKLEHGTIRADLATGEASGSIVVDARSGDTGIGARDNDMRESVLEAQKYPTLLLSRVTPSASWEGRSVPSKARRILTIHGARHEIVMDVQGRLVGNNLVASVSLFSSIRRMGYGRSERLISYCGKESRSRYRHLRQCRLDR